MTTVGEPERERTIEPDVIIINPPRPDAVPTTTPAPVVPVREPVRVPA